MTNNAELKKEYDALMDRMEAIKKRTDQIISELINKPDKWEPKGGPYWINGWNMANRASSDEDGRLVGSEFQTEAHAERAAEMRLPNQLLIAYFMEYCPDFVPVFDGAHVNYSVWYSHSFCCWELGLSRKSQDVGKIYFPKTIAKQLVDDLNTGRVSGVLVK